ncbi:MAG: PBP1A family penicillin-binding protein [Pseudomonadota bacterium]
MTDVSKKPDSQKSERRPFDATAKIAAAIASVFGGLQKSANARADRKAKRKTSLARNRKQASTLRSSTTRTRARPPASSQAKRRAQPQNTRSISGASSILSKLAIGFSFLSVGAAGGLALAFLVFAPREQIGADLWAVNRQPAVIILDRNNERIAARGARYGRAVEAEDLPDYLIQAFLATEDRRFYRHSGVDIRGTLRAFLTNLKSGGVVEGGSTITQQLAKNLFLSPEQTYTRKIREALLALWLEGHYSKEEILSLYLNRIYLGAGAYGVEQAAKTYFGKSARDVTLSEAAILAGLPKAPSKLAPTQNPSGSERRAHEVLDNLLEIGAVDPFEVRQAKATKPVLVSDPSNKGLGYFFDYVASQSRMLVGDQNDDLIVTTTLDSQMQLLAEAAVSNAITTEAKLAGAEEAALIAYDITGAMRAMVGGVSYQKSQFNRATSAMRQPGSAFKPFVYAAAMENGLRPSSTFVDEPIDINGWQPANYNDRYYGRMRLTEAMARSVNSISVQVTERIGRAKVAEVAKRLGVRADVPAHPSIALGASNITLDDLTAAYIPFAAGGYVRTPYAISEIAGSDGAILYTREQEPEKRVLSERVVRDMNHLLYQVMHSGTGRRARLGTRRAVGKTGTTNDWRDAWFIGYTAQLTAGVWVGNDDYRGMDEITGGGLPAQIWREFMLGAHKDYPRRTVRGATPAVTYTEEGALLSLYAEVRRGFDRVRRDGDPSLGRD